MSAADPSDAEEADLAAELALGVLDAEAHRAATTRAEIDPAFGTETLGWSERLAPLLDEVAPLEPSPELWRRIAASLFPSARADLRAPVRHASATAPLAALRRSRDRWRAATLAMAASVVALIAAGVWLRREMAVDRAAPLLVATLGLQAGDPPILASYDARRRVVLLFAPARLARPGTSPELWVLDAAGAPSALGLVDPGGPVLLRLAPEPAGKVRADNVLAVSLEPAGGSATGKPTGPVVAKGALRAL